MKKRKFRAIIYLIAFTAVLTIGIQVYRNIQNYQLNKQRLISDVQLALDTGVEAYYADLAKQGLVFSALDSTGHTTEISPSLSGGNWSGIWSNADSFVVHASPTRVVTIPDNPRINRSFVMSRGARTALDTLNVDDISSVAVFGESIPDTLDAPRFRNFANLIISLSRDSINFELMQGFVEAELERRKVKIPYNLIHYRHDTLAGQLNIDRNVDYTLSTYTKATYLPRDEKLEMKFDNASMIIIKRGMTDLVISLLIIVCVVGAMLYLYRVIYQQKELAEVKNDLINNITHEFKTPIATISTAIDGIVNFNEANDPKKTEKYLDISSNQLSKLNHMVEKLLETAILDSDRLLLTLEEVDVEKMLLGLQEKYQVIAGNKKISFRTEFPTKAVQADLFHLENAVSNLIDNAVKYGGSNIDIFLSEKNGKVEIRVVDDGQSIDKTQKERIFEKFYRVSTGNRHDVKGFGIGLYYTRKIIEKHGGSVLLNLDANKTSFEVAI